MVWSESRNSLLWPTDKEVFPMELAMAVAKADVLHYAPSRCYYSIQVEELWSCLGQLLRFFALLL